MAWDPLLSAKVCLCSEKKQQQQNIFAVIVHFAVIDSSGTVWILPCIHFSSPLRSIKNLKNVQKLCVPHSNKRSVVTKRVRVGNFFFHLVVRFLVSRSWNNSSIFFLVLLWTPASVCGQLPFPHSY